MDKQLLQSFNNLSVALQALADSLERNAAREKDGESPIADALKNLDVSEQLKLLSDGIDQIHKDNEKLESNQKEILQKLAKLTEKQKEDGKKIESTQQAIKGKKDQEGPKYIPDKKENKTITDGVKIIVLIAAGILAIGLAFKVIGKVDFKTVLSIAIALPLIAIAYKKIAETKVSLKDLKDTVKGLLIFSAAVAAASWVLSLTKAISVEKALTMVLIAASFAFIAPRIGGMAASMKNINIKGLLMMPLVLVTTALAIAASSYLLALVMPIEIEQAFTTVVIAATFALVAWSIGKLASSISGVSVKGVIMLPLVLVVTSLAIMASSYLLNMVQPVEWPQLLTAIGIAAMFTVVSYGLAKIAQAASRVSLLGAVMLPIILVATSYAIYKSSEFLSKTQPITFDQFITAIGVSIVFVVLSFALPRLAKAVEKIGIAKAALMPIVFVTLSLAVKMSSYVLAETRPIETSLMFNIVLQSIMLTVMAIAMGFAVFVLDKMGLTSEEGVKKAAMAGATILVLSVAIALSSFILAQGNYTNAPGWQWSLEAGLSILAFGLLVFGISKLNMDLGMVVKGAIVILALAATILATDFILGAGDYTKYPSWEWTWQTGAAILAYGLLAVAASFGIALIFVGAFAILIIAGTILATDLILGAGDYDKFPSIEWATATTILIVGFGAAMAAYALMLPLLVLGAISVAAIAGAILATDVILGEGTYEKFPSIEWATATTILIAGFGVAMAAYAFMSPLLALGAVSMTLIAGSILATDLLLGAGSYDKLPSIGWVTAVTLLISGFAVVMVAYALMSPALVLGAISMTVIAGAIVATDLLLGAGTYDKLPSIGWVTAVTLLISGFAVVMVAYALMSPALVLGAISMTVIAGAILATDLLLGAGEYAKYPSKGWATAVTLLISGFAVVMAAYALMSPVLVLGAISMTLIAGTILATDRLLGAGSYDRYPSLDWVTTTAQAIGRYALLMVGYALMAPVLVLGAVSMGIISTAALRVDRILSSGDFTKVPTLEYTKGVIGLMRAYGALMSTTGLMLPLLLFGKRGIVAISEGIVESASVFERSNLSYDLYPKKEWSEGVGLALMAFGPAMKWASENSGWFGSDADELKKVIIGIADSIVGVSNRIARGNYGIVIDPNYFSSLQRSYSSMFSIYDMTRMQNIDAEDVVGVMWVASSIASISKKIALGDYSISVPDNWGDNVRMMYVTYGELNDVVGSMYSFSFGTQPDGPDFEAIEGVGMSIATLSGIIASGNYDISVPAGYKESLITLYETYEELDDITGGIGWMPEMFGIFEGTSVLGIANEIVAVSQVLDRGQFKPIPIEYMGNVYENIKNYLKVIDLLSYRSVTNDLFGFLGLRRSTAVDLVKIASDYDRLADSITKLSNAITSIDIEKMGVLRSLTGTVVLMSLMDTDQFNSMMDALEERAGVLVDTINSLSPAAEAGNRGAGGASVGVKTPSQAAPAESPGTTKIVESLGRIERQLAMIFNSTSSISSYVSQIRANKNTTSLKSRK